MNRPSRPALVFVLRCGGAGIFRAWRGADVDALRRRAAELIHARLDTWRPRRIARCVLFGTAVAVVLAELPAYVTAGVMAAAALGIMRLLRKVKGR